MCKAFITWFFNLMTQKRWKKTHHRKKPNKGNKDMETGSKINQANQEIEFWSHFLSFSLFSLAYWYVWWNSMSKIKEWPLGFLAIISTMEKLYICEQYFNYVGKVSHDHKLWFWQHNGAFCIQCLFSSWNGVWISIEQRKDQISPN